MSLVPFVVLIIKFKVQSSKFKGERVQSSKIIVLIIKFKTQSSKLIVQSSKLKGIKKTAPTKGCRIRDSPSLD